jgi:hypothetical protein
MMANFAVIENNTVVNLIVADTKEIAETVTNLECIEYPDTSDIAIGNEFSEEFQWYVSNKPASSWIFDFEKKCWAPPIEKPSDGKNYGWNENSQIWVEIPHIVF